MTNLKLPAIVGAIFGASLVGLAACGGSSSPKASEAPSSSTSSSTASTPSALAKPATVKGTDFSLTLPKGWVRMEGTGAQEVLAYDKAVAKTGRGITVTRTPLKGDTSVTKVAAWVPVALEKAKAAEIKHDDPIKLGGSPAHRYSAVLPSSDGKKLRTVRLISAHKKNAYVVTLSGPEKLSSDEVLEANKDLLDSWAWKK